MYLFAYSFVLRVWLIFIFFCCFEVFTLKAQPLYDTCSNALLLCPEKVESITNSGASSTGYTFGEDDFNFCFTPQKTIWLEIKTNEEGGSMTLHLTNLNFITQPGSALQLNVIQAGFPCDGSTYTNDSCFVNIQTDTDILLDSLQPNSVYYLCFSGSTTNAVVSEFNMDVSVDGEAIDRIPPTISLWASKTIICEGESVFLKANLEHCPDSQIYHWYKNGELFAISDSDHIVTAAIQDGDVFSVENNCYLACTDTLSVSINPITVKTVPPLLFSNDTTIFQGQSALLSCYSSIDSIFWTPSFLALYPDSTQTLVFPEETTTFYGKAYVNGCPQTAAILVTVKDNLHLYNTFSPNGDGINDRWNIQGIENYPDAEVSIYTRWGQRVYFGISYKESNAWDGTRNGKKLEAGTYFYVIDLKAKTEMQPIKGSLNLIR